MTTGGWIFLTLGWGFVGALTVFSYVRLLAKKKR